MSLKDLNLPLLTKLASEQVDHVSCVECCKYYIAPETAACGHTLCHTCWRGRRSCPYCAAPLERNALKLNLPLQLLTEHVHALGDAFKKIFNIKLDEFELDTPVTEPGISDPSKNVKDWLASSQNHFSAPFTNSESCTQDVSNAIEISSNKIQIHTNSKKSKSPKKVLYVQQPQDDWDKIEPLPETETSSTKENLVAITNDANPFQDSNVYTTSNPRRSSRKRDISQNESPIQTHDISKDKHSSKNSSSETDKKNNKAKQNWINVKRMRKEFSKLNKKNRNKLNVSIEMCKKTQGTINKPITDVNQQVIMEGDTQKGAYLIEDNTPTLQEEKTPVTNTVNDNNFFQKNGNQSGVDSLIDNSIPKDSKISQDAADKVGSLNVQQNILEPDAEVNLQNNQGSTNKQCINDNIQNQGLSKMAFIKKGVLCPTTVVENNVQTINIDGGTEHTNDGIEITIKVGNTLTNIVIKKKNNDVQLKVNTDREVQTSLGTNGLEYKNNASFKETPNTNQKSIEINIGNSNNVAKTQIINTKSNTDCATSINKSTSTKKHTASADTATAQFEITESVEKELSNIMECEEANNNHDSVKKNNHDAMSPKNKDDADIFVIGSTHESVHSLKDSKHTASEILMPTASKQIQKHADKRDREINEKDDDIPCSKKFKSINDKTENIAEENFSFVAIEPSSKNENNFVHNSESMNYDTVMGQVFANIDADIEKSQKTKDIFKTQNKSAPLMQHSQIIQQKPVSNISSTQLEPLNKHSSKESNAEKYSENVFSVIEKDTENGVVNKGNDAGSTQRHIENLLTPGMCQDLVSTNDDNFAAELCTPGIDHDDSDKSVVEETPQKCISFSKQKRNEANNNNGNVLQKGNSDPNKTKSNSQTVESVISVSDSLVNTTQIGKDTTVIDVTAKKQTLETPLTINKFVDQIKHKSTPVARKSLNFDRNTITDDDDPEQTFCPSSVVAKTTQEKEFMTKAFEETPKSPIKNPFNAKSIKPSQLKYCIAGSCLSAVEQTNLKALCRKYNWKYVDKFTKELTHLVVSVDEENKSQRSVKYMCALAASKWIVSYEWVQACINTNSVAEETLYEVLDGTGEPGPKRSRMAKKKLFHGLTFYCLPPFSVLDLNTLKDMLEAAGGRVVDEPKAVKADAIAPALLLAEPEHTQEDRFTYLALELKIVPVNYEWVLNCLGSYTLSSIHDLLLCPSTLLPPVTQIWPAELIARDND